MADFHLAVSNFCPLVPLAVAGFACIGTLARVAVASLVSIAFVAVDGIARSWLRLLWSTCRVGSCEFNIHLVAFEFGPLGMSAVVGLASNWSRRLCRILRLPLRLRLRLPLCLRLRSRLPFICLGGFVGFSVHLAASNYEPLALAAVAGLSSSLLRPILAHLPGWQGRVWRPLHCV